MSYETIQLEMRGAVAEQDMLLRVHRAFGLDTLAWDQARGAASKPTAERDDAYAVLGMPADATDEALRQTAPGQWLLSSTLEIDKGLWKMPLDGSQSTQLTTDSRNWAWVSGGGVYGDRFSGDVAGAPNDVVRFDLRTRQLTSWFNPQMRSRLLAVDATGAALVITEGSDDEIWRVKGPGNAVKVWSGPPDGIRPDGSVAVDGTGVWLTGASFAREWAIFHFTPGGGMQQVATFTDRPISVAGPCA